MAWDAAAGTDLTKIPSRYTCTVDCAGALTLSTTLLPTTLFDDGVNSACGATNGICEPSTGLTMRFTDCTFSRTAAGAVAVGCGTVDVVDSGSSAFPAGTVVVGNVLEGAVVVGAVVVGAVDVGAVVRGADALVGEALSRE